MLSLRTCLGAPVSVKGLGIQSNFPFPLSLRAFMAARGCRDTSPLGPGPFKAGFHRLSNIPQSYQSYYSTLTCQGVQYTFQSVAGVNAIVYYPATVDGENAPIAGGRPFPLIAYGHARRIPPACAPVCPGSSADISRDFEQLSGILAHLARWGFVSIAPDLSWLAPAGDVGGRLTVLSDVLTFMLNESGSPFSPFSGLVMANNLGAIGYSASGPAPSLLATERHFPIEAAALLAPAGVDLVSLQAFSPKPVLIIEGTRDMGLLGARRVPATIYNNIALARKHQVTIEGANHFGYTDNVCLLSNNDDVASIAQADQQLIAKAYLAAFFRRYLNGERGLDGYLSGVVPVEEIKGFNITVMAETVSTRSARFRRLIGLLLLRAGYPFFKSFAGWFFAWRSLRGSVWNWLRRSREKR